MADKDLVDELLHESESTSLDFKEAQYPFSSASDDEKSELLKDILAFANSFRRADAYILIGVREETGRKATVVGINEHLSDAHLQQFVNGKTQRPLEFSYKAVDYDGLQIGVIHIPLQKRPLFLTRNYGKLEKAQVYIRRGSSTDVADPDEVAEMGAARSVPTQTPVLSAYLVHGLEDEHETQHANVSLEIAKFPPKSEIPDHHVEIGRLGLATGGNREFFRELAKFWAAHSRVELFRIRVRNEGGAPATDLRLEFTVPDDASIFVGSGKRLPDYPDQHGFNLVSPGMFGPRAAPDVTVQQKGGQSTVICRFEKIHAKAQETSNHRFYLGAKESQIVDVEALVYADQLSAPIKVPLRFQFTVTEASYDVEWLRSRLR